MSLDIAAAFAKQAAWLGDSVLQQAERGENAAGEPREHRGLERAIVFERGGALYVERYSGIIPSGSGALAVRD